MRIYVIDDDEIIRMALGRSLKAMNAEVRMFDNPSSAIEAVKSESVDLVICDYSLPELDGIETIKLIRGQQPEAKTLLLSGSTGDEAPIAAATKSGLVNRFLAKPWRTAELQSALKDLQAR